MENKEVKRQVKRGLWKPEEDLILKNYVETHGEGNWATVSKRSGLMRGGKSCRLRWKNYLRPDIKRGGMSQEEEDLIIRMHKLLGNRWSLIAGRLPGRTDNEVKNYWNTHLNKKRGHLAGSRRSSKKPRQDQYSEAIASLNAADQQVKEESAAVTEVEGGSSSYGVESPPLLIPNNISSTFAFEEGPSNPYWDSIFVFEAFGFGLHSHLP